MKAKSPSAKSHGQDPLEALLKNYMADFVAQNQSARTVFDGLRVLGIGLWPIVDHLTFRTLEIEKRAEEFLKLRYTFDSALGILEYENWFAKVYRRPGYPPLFIDQAFPGARGKGSLIPDWVKAFGDQTLHHVAIHIEEIESAVFYMEKQGVRFAGGIVGDKGSDLRQIFTQPEMKKGKPFSVVELTERHRGYTGFSPPQANRLMESTRIS